MEGLKAFIEFLSSYPMWAKLCATTGTLVAASTLALAPRSASETAHKASSNRLRARLNAPPGFTVYSYPSLCVGLIAPSAWSSEDATVRFGGGGADLIKRYEGTKGAVGLKLFFQNVQKNYIADVASEVGNQLDALRSVDANAQVGDVAFAGKSAKLFTYKQRTGLRIGEIRLYWVRIIPEVKLHLFAFIYDDAADKAEYWSEVDAIVSSVILDAQGVAEREKLLELDR